MNCIIVDDEYPARQELAYFINNFSSLNIIGEFDDSIKALEFIKSNRPDVVFLDINMPKLNGISLGEIINAFEIKPIIIFVTAYRDYAVDAFEIQAFDYILKPYSETRIVSTLSKIENALNKNIISDKITLWKDEKMMVVNVNDICYCEAHEREVHVYTKKDKYIVVSSISEFSKKLPEKNFFRCHRSYIVNINKITEIIPWFNNTYVLKVEGIENHIPVSRNNITRFKNIMNIL
ncbi:two component transcriptional regulator, LytTR family [Caloramator quimbayensis]|uniref:Stage 0 sporulation protein A homolog n=1 Tax=Caloramator quimbayensis TaxID=1147123 RepID=A0A1T4WRE2_9CLOT|nr:LytTR family DNA-binding domain-containing protein [Caloramator quimbayensis]SKA79924.1 two component transcriptional regulator, LytTR family [Caloramator quimbayensis]